MATGEVAKLRFARQRSCLPIFSGHDCKKAYHAMITYLVKKTGADGHVGRTVRETLHLSARAANYNNNGGP